MIEDEKVLFVEEEKSRLFCSEECITAYFTPEIDRLEREYQKRRLDSDFSSEEREKVANLRWITLQEPDEVWREKTPSGDYRYTLISEFKPNQNRFWYVCQCLFLRNEPSFLFVAFPTRNEDLLAQYRKGERFEWSHERDPGAPEAQMPQPIDMLADAWTEDETYRAQNLSTRAHSDIQPSEFHNYHELLEQTLEAPEEVWTVTLRNKPNGESSPRMFQFIRQFPQQQDQTLWYVIVARETERDDQLEIVEAFPTRDAALVQKYRRGDRENTIVPRSSRVIH